jgi:exodeoxyribonuclease X
MLIRCIDLETTGLPPDDPRDPNPHGIMEIGWCDFDHATRRIAPPAGELVNPGRAVTIEARAVHHISDADVEGAIGPSLACLILMGAKPRPLFPDGSGSTATEGVPDYFCAHNIDHEKKFFGGGEIPWLCTYKSALRVWPEAPGHKLQELRYFLDVDSDPDFLQDLAAYPHRAPDDAYVCAFILRKMIRAMVGSDEFKTEEEAIAKIAHWSKGPALLYMCWMKKHKGVPWSQVAREDPEYLLWIWNKSEVKDRDIRATVRYYLQLHGHLPKPQPQATATDVGSQS